MFSFNEFGGRIFTYESVPDLDVHFTHKFVIGWLSKMIITETYLEREKNKQNQELIKVSYT